ncbi:MAG: hypothetical protein KJN93_04740 [Alphaproteobacteria bacterium]|nr:hypothetical protein [Alphaproteobacteria bacterium]
MSDDDGEQSRLTDKLAKLAAAAEIVSPEGRALRADNPRSLLAAVLAEIDETMLARTLRFRTGSGTELSVDVFSRRLLRINPPAPTGSPKGFEKQALTDADTPRIHDLFRLFKAFSGSDRVAYVSSGPVDNPIDASEYGIAATTLADLWKLPLAKSGIGTPQTRIQRFCEECGEMGAAWIRLDGEQPVDTGGTESALAQLGAYAETALRDIREASDIIRAPAEGPRFVLLGQTGGLSVALAGEDGHSVLVLADALQIEAVAAAWRGIFI